MELLHLSQSFPASRISEKNKLECLDHSVGTDGMTNATDSCSTTSIGSRQNLHFALHVRFIDEALGLSPQHVVTEIRARPRTELEDIPRLYYSRQDIEMFRLMKRNCTSEIELEESGDAESIIIELETVAVVEPAPPIMKCVGFVDRADGRQGTTVVTKIHTRPYISASEKEEMFYSSSDVERFRQILKSDILRELVTSPTLSLPSSNDTPTNECEEDIKDSPLLQKLLFPKTYKNTVCTQLYAACSHYIESMSIWLKKNMLMQNSFLPSALFVIRL